MRLRQWWQTRFSFNLWKKRVVVSAVLLPSGGVRKREQKKKVIPVTGESGTQPPRKCPESLVQVTGDRAGSLVPVRLL